MMSTGTIIGIIAIVVVVIIVIGVVVIILIRQNQQPATSSEAVDSSIPVTSICTSSPLCDGYQFTINSQVTNVNGHIYFSLCDSADCITLCTQTGVSPLMIGDTDQASSAIFQLQVPDPNNFDGRWFIFVIGAGGGANGYLKVYTTCNFQVQNVTCQNALALTVARPVGDPFALFFVDPTVEANVYNLHINLGANIDIVHTNKSGSIAYIPVEMNCVSSGDPFFGQLVFTSV